MTEENKPIIWLVSFTRSKINYPITTTYKLYPTKIPVGIQRLLCQRDQTVGNLLVVTKEDFFESLMTKWGGEYTPQFSLTGTMYNYNVEKHLVFHS